MKKLFSFILLYSIISVINAQSIDVLIGNSSCEAGGELWACGAAQVLQVHKDIDDNCSDFDYACGATVRTVIDVCSPNMSETTVYQYCN